MSKTQEKIDLYVNSPDIVTIQELAINDVLPIHIPGHTQRVRYFSLCDPNTGVMVFTQLLTDLNNHANEQVVAMSTELACALLHVEMTGITSLLTDGTTRQLLRNEDSGKDHTDCVAAFSHVSLDDIDEPLLRATFIGARANPHPVAKPRLYCIVVSPRIVILGGGAVKQTRAFQDDPKLSAEIDRLTRLRAKLKSEFGIDKLRENPEIMCGRQYTTALPQ